MKEFKKICKTLKARGLNAKTKENKLIVSFEKNSKKYKMEIGTNLRYTVKTKGFSQDDVEIVTSIHEMIKEELINQQI